MTRQRNGFTLVELLVVTGIMAALFGLLLGASGQRPSSLRAAQDFASILLAAQSRGLGRPEGAAVIVEAPVVPVAAPRTGTILHDGTMLPPIVVGVTGGVLDAHADLVNGYKVRFRRAAGTGFVTISPWLALRADNPVPDPDPVPVRRESAGQTAANTIIAPLGGGIEAVVVRYPTTGPKPTTIVSAIAIDLRHSGVGDDPAAAHGHGTFENQGPVAIVFDQTGRVSEVILLVGSQGGTEALVPNEPIYFYFAEQTSITANESLSSDRSAWVAINPQTGRINVSSNVPSVETDLVAARDKARQAIAIGN